MPLPEPGFPEMSIMASTATRAAIMPFRLIESPSPPAELALVAFQDDMMFTLMFTNHVWRATGAVWLDHAARGKSGQLSLNSAMSLAQANFGRAHRLSEVEEQGISLYGQCLRTLAVELANKPNQCQDLLIPVLVLTMLAVS